MSLVLILAAALAIAACSESKSAIQRENESEEKAVVSTHTEKPPAPVKGYQKLDETWILTISAPSFDALPSPQQDALRIKSQKAIAANEAIYRRNGPEHLRIKRMLEQILLHSDRLPKNIRKKIQPFAARFWLHHGNKSVAIYGKATGYEQIFRPSFIPGELAAAAQVAVQSGATMDYPKTIEADLAADKLQELEALLNTVRPWIFEYDAPNHAEKDAGSTEVEKIKSTGADTFKSSSARVSLEQIVSFVDPTIEASFKKLQKKTQLLDSKVRDVGGRKSSSPAIRTKMPRAVTVLEATGEAGPFYRNGSFDLFDNGAVVLAPEGDGLLMLVNLLRAYYKIVDPQIASEFAADNQVERLRNKWGFQASIATSILKQIAGKGSDGTDSKSPEWLSIRLAEMSTVVEIMRSDLAALYLAFDRDVAETGLVPNEACAKVIYDIYISTMFERLALKETLEEKADPAYTARKVVVKTMIEAGAILVENTDEGDLNWRVVDYSKARKSVEKLLAEVRRIRFVGDSKAARNLLDKYGRPVASEWRDNISQRWTRAGLPNSIAFSYPLFQMHKNHGDSSFKTTLVEQTDLIARQLSIASLRSLIN